MKQLATLDSDTSSSNAKKVAKTAGLNRPFSPMSSYARIRSEYINDPDYIFVILSLKHKVYSEKQKKTGMTNGIMEVTSSAVYDLKYISAADLSYNPALGTGQIQIRDIHYVQLESRTTWEFCQLLDEKFKRSRSRGEESWLVLARKHGWIKEAE
jgi:hypothetical protein